jgi:hypothetical protein
VQRCTIACAVLTVPGVRMTESRPVIWPWEFGKRSGSQAGTRSTGYDPVKSDFIHASHL